MTLQATSTHDAEMKASIAMGEENFKREASKVAGKWWSNEKIASKKLKGTLGAGARAPNDEFNSQPFSKRRH